MYRIQLLSGWRNKNKKRKSTRGLPLIKYDIMLITSFHPFLHGDVLQLEQIARAQAHL